MKLSEKDLLVFNHRRKCPICGKELFVSNATIRRQSEHTSYKHEVMGAQRKVTIGTNFYYSLCCKKCHFKLTLNSLIVRVTTLFVIPGLLFCVLLILLALLNPFFPPESHIVDIIAMILGGIIGLFVLVWFLTAIDPSDNGYPCRIVGKWLRPFIGKYRIDYNDAEIIRPR